MRSIQELAAAANITDTSTTNISDFKDTLFSTELEKFGEDFRFLQQVVNHNDELTKSRGGSVRLFNTTGHLDVTKTHTEGDERTYTEMTNLESTDVTPTWDMGAIAITKEVISDTKVDLVAAAKYMIVQDGEKNVEEAINTAYNAASTNIVYGGDATSTATLATGDVMTPDVIADARKLVRDNKFAPTILAIGTAQESALLKDSQFVNASEYGGREIILNGEIGKYLGMKVMVTTNMTAATTWGGGSLNGTVCYIIGKNQFNKWPATLAWKERLNYDTEFLKRYNNHYIYRDGAYAAALLGDFEKAVSLIKVSDA